MTARQPIPAGGMWIAPVGTPPPNTCPPGAPWQRIGTPTPHPTPPERDPMPATLTVKQLRAAAVLAARASNRMAAAAADAGREGRHDHAAIWRDEAAWQRRLFTAYAGAARSHNHAPAAA